MIEFDDEYFMGRALVQAEAAYAEGEVPVGAVAVRAGEIIAKSHNQVETLRDATAHAEILLVTQVAAAIGDWRLTDVDVYVTKEPCAMCAGAMVNARVRRLIFGASDPRAGAAGSALDVTGFAGMLHNVEVAARVREEECRRLIQAFFHERRGTEQSS